MLQCNCHDSYNTIVANMQDTLRKMFNLSNWTLQVLQRNESSASVLQMLRQGSIKEFDCDVCTL